MTSGVYTSETTTTTSDAEHLKRAGARYMRELAACLDEVGDGVTLGPTDAAIAAAALRYSALYLAPEGIAA